MVWPRTRQVACAVIRYPSDDINKFLWMVRIGGGVFPDIKEPDYLGERGYTIDDKAGKVSLLPMLTQSICLRIV